MTLLVVATTQGYMVRGRRIEREKEKVNEERGEEEGINKPHVKYGCFLQDEGGRF